MSSIADVLAKLEQMENKLSKLELLEPMSQDINSIKEAQVEMKADIGENKSKIGLALSEISSIKKENIILKSKLERLESDAKRNNVVIYNVDEKENDRSKLLLLVSTLFKDMMGITLDSLQLESAIRLGAVRRGGDSPDTCNIFQPSFKMGGATCYKKVGGLAN
uniref:Cytoplasmic dynein 1 heavy chain 1 n=1 Tax=Lygus hesperus TaxID=30085 RepID=A0A0A9Y4J9_LYGHE